MYNIYDCVDAFSHLLYTQYEITIGKKGVAVTLKIRFDKKDCFHLMGLQYLKDRGEINRNRSVIFAETNTDYSKNQPQWTLLHKKKINLISGTEIVLYDQMK